MRPFIDFDAGAGYFIRDHAKYYPGKKAGIIFACGLCTGLIAHTAAVSLGLSLILYNSPVAFSVLKYMGAAYLIYLGVKSYIHRKENINFGGVPEGNSDEYTESEGAVVLYCIFPQFVSPTTGEPGRRVTDTGIAFYGAGHCYILVGSLAADRLSRRLMQNARFSLIMHIIESLVYFAIGISLIFVTV